MLMVRLCVVPTNYARIRQQDLIGITYKPMLGTTRMDIETIKEANKKVDKLESIRYDLKKINCSKAVDSIKIERYQSGAMEYSYKIEITEDQEFLKTVKALIIDKLEREEKKLSKELSNI